ncbi:MAG: DUF4214 domain-containing protein [Solobacterium sp.]|nr:DUF4214 domain-containing protein [Solobacterium sp.]
MKKRAERIARSAAVILAVICLLLQMSGIHAETKYTLHILDTNDVEVTSYSIEKGSSLEKYLQAHPSEYANMTWGDTSRIPLLYSNAACTVRYDPNSAVTKDLILYVSTVWSINDINLRLIWPKAGQSAGNPGLYPSEHHAAYYPSSYRWLKTADAKVPYTGVFQQGATYYLEAYLYPVEQYGFYTFGNTLKAYINGGQASYTAEPFPSNGIRIVYAVKIDDPVQAFVRRLYNMCLFREPEPAGFQSWSGKLKNKTITAAQTVYGFFNSSEFLNNGFSERDFVETCYEVLMNRAYDLPGLNDWLDALDNGVSRNFVLRGFVGSNEFKALCAKYGIAQGTITLTEPRDQNYGITSFVARCYKKALGRSFDVPGLNTWCKKILAASSKKAEAIKTASDGFFHSAEFKNHNYSNSEYLKRLYRTFLNREPDQEGFADWLKHMQNGMSRDQVLYGFAYSPEFTKLMASYGIK